MNERFPLEELLEEIARYLETVETFRAEGCEPTWRPDLLSENPAFAARMAAPGAPAARSFH